MVEFQTYWIHILKAWWAREFNQDEIISWKYGNIMPWVHYICPTFHGKGKNIHHN